MFLDAWLPRAAAIRPAAVALETGGAAITYAELLERAARAAGALASDGVAPGDRVALALEPGAELVVALHACWLLGAAALPLDLRLPADERAARAAGAVRVVEEAIAPGAPLRPLPAAHDPDAVATGMHTSGTTGAARPVDLTYANWAHHAAGSALALGLDPQERWLGALPTAHVGGLSILVRSAIYGTTAVLHPRFDAVAATHAVMDDGITLVSLVPTMLARMLDVGLEHPPALRCALIGGGPLDPALADRAWAAGVPAAQTYGMTETTSQVATSLPGEPETAGRPLAGVRIAIADDGEILVSGPVLGPGAAGPDGVLRTGDLGALDDRGRLRVTGRRADTIVSGGENVAPQAVEAVLLAHPDVAEAAVFGVPDPEWGEAVVARVVPRDGIAPDPGDLRAHCAARLAGFQVPKRIETAATLPRTPSGKLLRRELLRA